MFVDIHAGYLNSHDCVAEFLLKVDIVKIACGNHHVVALTNEGHLYAWGRGNHGQLGLGNLQDWQVEPFFCFPSPQRLRTNLISVYHV